MTTTEFESYLEKGLGRAILLLREEPDKTPFREVAFRYLTLALYEGLDYQFDLLACFDDRDALAEEVARQNLRQAEALDVCDVPLLLALGYQKEYTEILEDQYRTYRQKIRDLFEEERTNEGTGISGFFLGIVSNLIVDTAITQERVRAMLPDLAVFFALANKWGIFYYDAAVMYRRILPLWGNDTDALFREISALPHGEGLIEQMKRMNYLPPNPAITTEEILSLLPLPPLVTANYCRTSFCLASREVVEDIAEKALATDDPAVRTDLFSLFLYNQVIDGKLHRTPAFPFPEKLLRLIKMEELWEVEQSRDKEKAARIFGVLSLLAKICHPGVAALGKLLRDPAHPSYHDIGWEILKNNYTPEDREELISALSVDASYIENCDNRFYCALRVLLHAAELGTHNLPLEMLLSFWPHMHSRESIAEILLRYHMMPENIREESRYDRNPKIRKLIKEYP